MNRTKTIYFLSAFVLIIGCYALNLSYSLFTQTVTPENNTVNASIPYLSARLETNNFTIPANSSKIIKLNILNEGTADIKYGISTTDTKGTTITLINGYNITGEVSGNATKEILLYITNPTDSEVTDLTFTLTSNYTTIKFDETTFISNSLFEKDENGNLITIELPLLKDAILARTHDSTITDTTKTVYNESFNLNSISTSSGEIDRILSPTEDDYGTSYVFRGNIDDNYVKFAGFIWRIVRINGDGSIRLILDGTLDSVKREGLDVSAGGLSMFNSISEYSAYYNVQVGYMYGDVNIQTYDGTHQNINSSTIKKSVDKFYETYIENDANNYHYKEYIADVLFCADKTIYSGTGRWKDNTLYGARGRNNTVTLKCANGATNNYSRFTSISEDNIENVNNDLKYPIGLLSSDELIMAGAYYNTQNINNYLYDATKEGKAYEMWWTMSPYYYDSSSGTYVVSAWFSMYSFNSTKVDLSLGVRPVINLKATVKVIGEGTDTNPYEVISVS